MIKFLTQEIAAQFAAVMLEAKEEIRRRGEFFEVSEQAQVMKSRLAEVQAERRNIHRRVGQQIYQTLADLEDNHLGPARRALFGEEHNDAYQMLLSRIAFVENGRDDLLFLGEYVLLGNYQRDADRFETVDRVMFEFLRDDARTGGEPGREALSNAASDGLAGAGRARGGADRLADAASKKAGGMLARVGIGADEAPPA